ncbi:MAG: pyridoxal-phosphate-dependent aminotransferase family protein [Syntrophothermus sp.]
MGEKETKAFDEKFELRIPGPTPLPPRVARAMSRPMISHRGNEFATLNKVLLEKLKPVFGTQNDVLILTGSGTAGLEAAVANVVSPGDEVLVVVTGVFGERFAKICGVYGARVERLDTEWGKTADPREVELRLAKNPRIKAVFATHNETSTGVANDIAAIGQIVARTPAVFVVDTVSALGGMEFRTDAWHVDVAVTGSQKCLMLPPGLAVISVSPKAWKVIEGASSPRFYLDLRAYRDSAAKGQTPYTPNISLYFGLEESLRMLEEEGLENSFRRHDLMKRMVRAGVRALGFELLAQDAWASATVTAIKGATGLEPDTLRKVVRTKYGVVLSGGQKSLEGKIFRIGHMGYATPMDMLATLAAVELGLAEITGANRHLGAAVRAAQETWLGVKGE